MSMCRVGNCVRLKAIKVQLALMNALPHLCFAGHGDVTTNLLAMW